MWGPHEGCGGPMRGLGTPVGCGGPIRGLGNPVGCGGPCGVWGTLWGVGSPCGPCGTCRPCGIWRPLQLALGILRSCGDVHHTVSFVRLVALWVCCPGGGRGLVQGACVEFCSPPAAVSPHSRWRWAWVRYRGSSSLPPAELLCLACAG